MWRASHKSETPQHKKILISGTTGAFRSKNNRPSPPARPLRTAASAALVTPRELPTMRPHGPVPRHGPGRLRAATDAKQRQQRHPLCSGLSACPSGGQQHHAPPTALDHAPGTALATAERLGTFNDCSTRRSAHSAARSTQHAMARSTTAESSVCKTLTDEQWPRFGGGPDRSAPFTGVMALHGGGGGRSPGRFPEGEIFAALAYPKAYTASRTAPPKPPDFAGGEFRRLL